MNDENWCKTISVYSFGKMLNCTGWKLGFGIGPQNLIKQALLAHEASVFCVNVPGQIAISRVLDEMWTEPFGGCSNYFEWTSKQFEQAYTSCLQLLEKSTGVKFKATKVESGYFIVA